MERLRLSHTSVTSAGLAQLRSLPKLRVLTLIGCPETTLRERKWLEEVLRDCHIVR